MYEGLLYGIQNLQYYVEVKAIGLGHQPVVLFKKMSLHQPNVRIRENQVKHQATLLIGLSAQNTHLVKYTGATREQVNHHGLTQLRKANRECKCRIQKVDCYTGTTKLVMLFYGANPVILYQLS